MGLRIVVLLVMLVSQQGLAACEQGRVSRALLTTGIADREPVDVINAVSDDTTALFAYTEIMDAEGSTLLHRWFYGDELVAEVPLTIRGKRWRTWSSKNLGLRRDNNWQVRVVDQQDCELFRLTLLAPPPAHLADPILSLVATGDIAGAKVKLAQTSEANPDHAKALALQLEPAITLARVEADINADALYIARSRLQSIDPASSEQARKKTRLQRKIDERSAQVNRDAALMLRALEQVFAASVTPCPLAREQASAQLAAMGKNHLTVISSEADTSNWALDILDQRTGMAHRATIACETVTAEDG